MIDDGKRRKRRRWQRKTRAMSTGNRKAQPWRQKYQGTALIARWTKHGFDCKLMVARPRISTWTCAQHGLDRYVVPEVLRSPQSFAEQHAVSVMVNSGKRNSKGYSPGLKIDVADDITVVLSLCTASWKLLTARRKCWHCMPGIDCSHHVETPEMYDVCTLYVCRWRMGLSLAQVVNGLQRMYSKRRKSKKGEVVSD